MGGGDGYGLAYIELAINTEVKFHDEVNTIFQVPAILPKFIQCYLSEENIALCWWHSVKLLPIWLA